MSVRANPGKKPVNPNGIPTKRSPHDVPNATARGQLVSSLVRLGYKGQDLSSIITTNRTYAELADALIELQRRAPKA